MLIKLEVLIWYLMMHKNRKWVDSPHTRQWRYLKNEREDQSKGTGEVPAKNPLKVKSVIEKSPRTQECKS